VDSLEVEINSRSQTKESDRNPVRVDSIAVNYHTSRFISPSMSRHIRALSAPGVESGFLALFGNHRSNLIDGGGAAHLVGDD